MTAPMPSRHDNRTAAPTPWWAWVLLALAVGNLAGVLYVVLFVMNLQAGLAELQEAFAPFRNFGG